MKPTTLFTIFAALGVAGTEAALIAGDSFLTGGSPNYNTGDLNTQNPTVTGFTGAWTGSTNIDVTATGLSYTGLDTSGGAVFVTGSGGGNNGRVSHVLSTSYTNSSTETVYISFLMQLGSATSNQFRAFELFNGDHTVAADANRTLELGSGGSASPSSTTYGLRFKNDPDLADRINLGAADTAVNLFVLRFDLSATALSDTLTIYRNPTLGLEPMVPTATLTGLDIQFDRVTLARFGDSGTTRWDEIRVGSDFASVTIPEPSVSILGLASGLALLARRRR